MKTNSKYHQNPDYVDHARSRFLEFHIDAVQIHQEFDKFQECFGKQIPEFFMRSLNIYLKHDPITPSVLSIKGPKGQPVLAFDFVNDTLLENLKMLSTYSKDINIETELHLFFDADILNILTTRQTIRLAKEKAEEAQARKEENRIRKEKAQATAQQKRQASIELAKQEALIIKENKEKYEKQYKDLRLAEASVFDLKCSNVKELSKACKVLSNYYGHQAKDATANDYSEQLFEDAIVLHKEKFGLKDWFFMYRQFTLSIHGRIDLVYRNASGEVLVIELEVGPVSKDHFSKSRIYRRQLSKDLGIPVENIKILLIANEVHETIQEECDDLGMKVFTMSEVEILNLMNIDPIQIPKQNSYVSLPERQNNFKRPWYSRQRA